MRVHPFHSSPSVIGRAVATLVLAAASHAIPAQTQPQAPVAASASASDIAEIQRLTRAGQHAQALKLIDESLARNPKDPQMRFRRGVALSMLDRKAEALTVFQKLVEDHPEMPSPYNNLAVLYGSQGDYEKARQALERAIRTNPAYATAYQNLGDVYAQLASQAYSKALQLDKSDTSVQPKLALLRELVSPPTAPGDAPDRNGATRPSQVPTAAAPQPATKSTLVATAPVKPPVAPLPTPTPVPNPATSRLPAKPGPSTPALGASTNLPSRGVAAVASKSVTTSTPTSSGANAAADVEAAVRAWAAAWSRRDIPAYTGAYTPDFAGQARSHRAWEDDRKARIVPRKHISVEVSDLRVKIDGDKAQARFRQTYESDALNSSGHKTLDLVRADGKWLIKRESTGG